MFGLKVNVPLLRTSASVLAVMLVTSGAYAEDEITAGTDPRDDGVLVDDGQTQDEVIFVVDPLPDDIGGGEGGEVIDDGLIIVVVTGDEGTGDDGTGEDGTGEDGTGDEGTGDEGTGEDGTGDDGTVDGTDGVEIIDNEDFGGGEVGDLPDVLSQDGGMSDCGGCEYQMGAGPTNTPAGATAQTSRSDFVSAPVKDICADPELYVAWMCDWQKGLGLIGQ